MKQNEKHFQNKKPFETNENFIVAIGASAGGLDALYDVFSSPLDRGTSYIIIQHLPADFKSTTAELLRSNLGVEVVEIEDNMTIVPERIYVLSQRQRLSLQGDVLRVEGLEMSHTNNPIDFFFTSLAENQGANVIGVVLSGSNKDGTIGAAKIKDAGGFIIAQDPTTTGFGTMPMSIINAGLSDLTLAPKLILEEIGNYTYLKRFGELAGKKGQYDIAKIIEIVKEHSSFDFTEYKQPTLHRRIIKRMMAKNMESISEYTNFLEGNPEEIEELACDFLINVTSFFRDANGFELLAKKVLPQILENDASDEILKIWSVGCATGEEAYSLAILVDELLKAGKSNAEVKIFATDIDKKALAKASKGIYPKSIEKDVSKERLATYFNESKDEYRIKEQLRKMVIFAEHDITKHPPYHKVDLILCRNVLIYLNSSLQKRILSTLHFCLKPDGYLFLGPSESLGSLQESLLETEEKLKIYRNIKPAKNLQYLTYSPPVFLRKDGPDLPEDKDRREMVMSKLEELINRELINELHYDGVCVDSDFKILKTLGNYQKYLLPEMFNFNLLDLLPEALSMVVSSSTKKARKQDGSILVKKVVFEEKGKRRSVDVMVKGFEGQNRQSHYFLVLFKEAESSNNEVLEIEEFDSKIFAKRHLLEIEEELKETRYKLHEAEEALIESLDNAQAYSEELISNNEELQSINEELHTVNNDNNQKMRELVEVNDQLNNYFRSTTNSQLYVDSSLVIRKFTPLAFKQINLKESDIGRPLADIHSNIKFSTLLSDIENTMNESKEFEKEVQTLDGKWYQMRLTPYLRMQDNQTDGVVITFADITALKRTEEKLKEILNDHDTFIYSVSHDLRNDAGNVLISSELLSKNIDDMDRDQIKEFSNVLLSSAKGLWDIIADVTDISKIEDEIWKGKYKNVNISELYKEVKQSLNRQITDANAIITTDFQVQEIPFLKKNLRSIMLNLLTNALKYRTQDRISAISIKTEEKGNYILLTVTDNGIGIKKEKIKDLFVKYKRFHHSNSKGVEGTGIGMYLIKKMITNSGGKIEVNSAWGEGTTFEVYFLSSR